MLFLDILCILPIALSIVFGAKSGAVKLMIGFIFFIMSLWLTYLIFPSFGDVLARHMENEFLINFVSISFAFVMSSIFCSIIATSLKKMTGESSGGFIDRFLGIILGFGRGLILSLIIFLVITIITGVTYIGAETMNDLVPNKDHEQPDWIKDSFSYDKMLKLTDFTVKFIGEDSLKSRPVPDFVK